MRLRAAVTELVHDVIREAYGQSMARKDPELATLLEAVLADPNLHPDSRMRLHEQIPELVWAAHAHAAGRTPPARVGN